MRLGKIGARRLLRGLPYDAEVEYLANTDNNYIDTEVYGDGDLDYEITFSSAANAGSYPYVFGSQISDRQARFSLMWGGRILFLNNGTVERTVAFDSAPSILTAKKIRLDYYIDGVLKGNFINNAYTTPSSILLFACHETDSVRAGQRLYGKIYRLKFLRNGVLVRDLVPVRLTNEQGQTEGAMYDKRGVGGMNPDGSARTDGLYRNQGTGAFVLGPDKTAQKSGGG